MVLASEALATLKLSVVNDPPTTETVIRAVLYPPLVTELVTEAKLYVFEIVPVTPDDVVPSPQTTSTDAVPTLN